MTVTTKLEMNILNTCTNIYKCDDEWFMINADRTCNRTLKFPNLSHRTKYSYVLQYNVTKLSWTLYC